MQLKCSPVVAALFVAALAFALSGCVHPDDTGASGDNSSGVSSDGSGTGSNVPTAPYAGTWIGPWTDSVNAQNGTLNLTISSGGTITGNVVNSSLSATGTVSGSIFGYGDIAVYITYPAQTTRMAGRLLIDANGHLAGSASLYTYPENFYITTVAIDLIKQ